MLPEHTPGCVAPGGAGQRWLPPLLVFTVAFAIRVLFLQGMEAYPRFELIKNRLDDQVTFHLWAKAIASNQTFDYAATAHEFAYWAATRPGVYPQTPLYPYFLSACYRIFGYEYDLVRLVQMMLGASTAVLLYLVALQIVGSSTALACGVAVAFYGPFVFYETTYLRAAVLSFTVVSSLLLALRTGLGEATRRFSFQSLCLTTGVVLGLGVLLRSTVLVLAMGTIAWVFVERSRRRGAVPGTPDLVSPRRAAFVVLTGLVLSLLPVIAANSIRSGGLAFLSSNGGYIFFIGNVHDAPGNSAGPSPYYYAVKRSGPREEINLFAEALRDIRRHPGDYLRLQLRKTAFFFNPEEVPNNVSYNMAKKTNPRLRLAFLEYYVVFPAALLGILLSLRQPRRFVLLYVFVLLYAAGTIPFYVLGRLRQPIVLPLVIFAGVALQWWARQVAARHWGRAATALVVVTAATCWCRPAAPVHRPTDYAMAAAAEFSLAEQLAHEMRLADARRHYARAVALNPDHETALMRVLSLDPDPTDESRAGAAEALRLCEQAREAAEARDFALALRLLRTAARRAPRLALPYQYQANVYVMMEDRRRAMEALERATEIAPGNAVFRENLKALRQRVAATS